MAKPAPLQRIAILGGGPIGLEAALYAKTAGLPVTLYEQGQPAEYLNRWGFVKMFTPLGMNVTPLGRMTLLKERPPVDLPPDTDYLTGREFREKYLLPLATSSVLKDVIRPPSTVLSIGRTGWRKTDLADPRKPLPPFKLLIREGNAERFDTADVILDCTGTYARPNWVGDGGIPAAGEIASRPHIAYWLEDVKGARKQVYAGKSVVLIGSGYSAASTLCDLADIALENQSTWVIWLAHGNRTQPLPRIPADPLKERDRLATKANSLATRCDGNLEYHPQAQVDEVVCHGQDKGFRVAARVGGKVTSWEVEKVIANVGYRPDMMLTAELRVAEPAGGAIQTDEPGYYILGAKSRGRDGNFLLRDGHEQIKKAFGLILGNARTDLYAKAA